MPTPFNVQFSVSAPPSEAQARAVETFAEPSRAVGLRLTKRGPGELQYRPQVHFPFLIVLWRTMSGERMTARFKPGEAGGTRVTIDGAVARNKHPLAASPEHWTEALVN
jgi:hypothetical protein